MKIEPWMRASPQRVTLDGSLQLDVSCCGQQLWLGWSLAGGDHGSEYYHSSLIVGKLRHIEVR